MDVIPGSVRISNIWKCNSLETMTQLNIYVLEGAASNQVQRIIGQKFFLKSDMYFIRQFFHQPEF
jgi:hypothetical protein